MLIALAAALLFAGPVQDSPGFERTWSQYGPDLAAEGVPKNMARSAFLWAEGQYHLGLCRPYLSARSVQFWRRWWDDTTLASGPFGRMFIDAGEKGYVAGLEAAATDPLDAAQCQRVTDSWIADMRAAAELAD